MEFYNEIHGVPIFDVYDDDDEQVVHDYGKPDPVFSMRSNMGHIEDVEASLREVQDEFQKLKFSVVDKFKVIEETMNRLMEAATRSSYGGRRTGGGNAQRSSRCYVTSHYTNQTMQAGTIHVKRFYQALSNRHHHHTSRTKKRHRPVRAKKTPQTEKKKKTSQTTWTTTEGATKTTKKFTPTGRGIKKLHRHHVRTIVLGEIRNYQRITKLLICKLPFQCLVHDRGRHRNFPMKHSSDLPRQPSHNTLVRSLVQTSFLHQYVIHGCYHGSNKKLLEFGVGGFTHKSMNFGDKVLLDGGVMMGHYLRKKMTWPRVLVILISSGMCFFAHVLSG